GRGDGSCLGGGGGGGGGRHRHGSRRRCWSTAGHEPRGVALRTGGARAASRGRGRRRRQWCRGHRRRRRRHWGCRWRHGRVAALRRSGHGWPRVLATADAAEAGRWRGQPWLRR
ncbi:unnamed protein product, partial [Phaeothamnion confervicola]